MKRSTLFAACHRTGPCLASALCHAACIAVRRCVTWERWLQDLSRRWRRILPGCRLPRWRQPGGGLLSQLRQALSGLLPLQPHCRQLLLQLRLLGFQVLQLRLRKPGARCSSQHVSVSNRNCTTSR